MKPLPFLPSLSRRSRRTWALAFALTLALPAATERLSGASFYRAGDLVENFTLVHRTTRQPVELKDLQGRIVFLEWFAWWCPYCQAAAPQVAAGIVEWYASRGGNPAGLPVMHVAINLQPNQELQTQNFVERAGFDYVLEDFRRDLANRFQSGGQPIFAIINGVSGSPSHQQWELLAHQDGYGQRDFSESLARFRAIIDSVQAPPTVLPPRITRQPMGGTWEEGDVLRLSVEVEGTPPLGFSWYHDDERIPGVDGAELTLANLNASNAGTYRVEIGNAGGRVESDAAVVVVRPRSLSIPRIVDTRLSGLGTLLVAIEGADGDSAVLEASADLRHWQPVATLAAMPGIQEVEISVREQSWSFFRVRNQR